MNLPRTTDVAVVGCGIFGLSSAAWSTMAGRTVVAVDRSHIGAGSSGRSGATIGAFYYNEMMAKTVVDARERIWSSFDDVFRIPGARQAVFEKSGMIIVAGSGHDERSQFSQWGVDIRKLTVDGVQDRFPWLKVPAHNESVWWDEAAGHVDTAPALFRLKECIHRHGGIVAEHCPVYEAKKESNNTWLIRTPAGDVSAGQLLLAPGPWAAELGRMVDLDLPVEAQRVQVTLVNRQGTMPSPHPVISDRINDFYARSHKDGVSHVGLVSTAERLALTSMTEFDESIQPDLAMLAKQNFETGVPGAGDTLLFGHRPAVYEVTPDEYFILGKTPHQNLFVAAGGSGHGYKFGPLIGEQMAALMNGEDAPFATSPLFSLERKYDNKRGVLGD